MSETVYDIRKIAELLPHRYPMLLVDRVISISDPGGTSRVGRKAVGIKNVTFNEPHFTGHFPDLPIMPGVLQIEAMAQLAAVAYYRDGDAKMNFMIASVQDAKFRRPVVPGDVLTLTIEILKERGPMMQVATKCEVDGELVSEATLLAHVSPQSQSGKK